MKGGPQLPTTERSVRYGYHWAVARQIDRVGRAIETGHSMGAQVGYLKNLCRPFWRGNEAWLRQWDEVKEEIWEEMEGRKKKEKIARLRQEQLNLLIDLLWDNEVLVDEGIPVENIELLDKRE